MTATHDLIWGQGSRLLELFLEPTCPFSAKAFANVDKVADRHGDLRIRIWLHSQPWHLLSPLHCRGILAASMTGRDTAHRLMTKIYQSPGTFAPESHGGGGEAMSITPEELLDRMSEAAGIDLTEDFADDDLTTELKRHTKYARQNGIHVSPTAMVDGLVTGKVESDGTPGDWLAAIG